MEFPSNSNRAPDATPKPEEKKIDKVVVGDVERRKKGFGGRLKETLVGGDAKSVWGYILFDVLVPAAKDTVSDAVSQGVERMIFGETRGGPRRSTGGRPGSGYVSYNKMGSSRRDPREDDRYEMSRRNRATHDFDDIVLATRAEGVEVLERLYSLVEQYGAATVADLYELLGLDASHTDAKWGWDDMSGSGIDRVRGGRFKLDLPRTKPVD